MNSEHDAYADWDAAYVLGALSSQDRRLYEAHLATCQICTGAVSDLASMPGLLQRIRPGSCAEMPQVIPSAPTNLFENVMRKGRRRVWRKRIGFALAAVVVAVTAVGVPAALLSRHAPEQVVALAQHEEAPTSMEANVELDTVAWGTRLTVECAYPEGEQWADAEGPWSYSLVVTDTDGVEHEVSSWKAVPGKTVQLEAGTALAIDDIAAFDVRSGRGEIMLSGTRENSKSE